MLFPGNRNIGRNIETEIATGKPRRQAIAIALNTARKTASVIPRPNKKEWVASSDGWVKIRK